MSVIKRRPRGMIYGSGAVAPLSLRVATTAAPKATVRLGRSEDELTAERESAGVIKRHVRGMIYGSGESTPRSVRLRASSASSATVRLRTEGHIEVYWLPSTVRELRELPPEHATEILRATARLSPEPDEQSALEGKLTSDDKTFLWRLVSTSNADDLPDYFVIYKAPHPNLLVVIAVVPLQDASRDTAGTEVTEAFPQEDRIRQVLTEDADEILRRCGEIWEANGMNSSEEVCELLQGPESLRGDDHS